MKSQTRDDQWMLALGFLGFVAVMALAAMGGAIAAPVADRSESPGSGCLVARSPEGGNLEFPLEHTDVDIAVSGFMARAQVRQVFTNPFDERIEATYVFPLPENAAVDDMTMRIGDRVIKGLIKEKGEAARIYREARRSGKTAAMLTQERPNVFTQAVANILPGDRIEITISYVQYLKYEKGTMSLVFPTVVGPRFIPGASVDPDGTVSTVFPGTEASVHDAERITPPVLRPGIRSGHDLSLRVMLGAGVPFTHLRSKSHSVLTSRHDESHAVVELSPSDTIPNKDFILQWDVDPRSVSTGLLTHRSDDTGYFTLMLVPPTSPRPELVTPKEMVFVLDCSGSMSGRPMEQAKSLVRHALMNLNPGDSFQIINFSMTARGLAPLPLPNTQANVEKGIRYIDSLHGGGGTMMLKGIEAAMDFPEDPERLRVVMFLTDGYIGNEARILAAIGERRTRARLFSFGVGSSVNRYLLENMALEGRGTVRYVRPDEDATGPVKTFYDEVRSPVFTDVEIDWGGLDVSHVLPARVPDVFAGHPILVTGRYTGAGRAEVRVQGRSAGEMTVLPVEVTLPHEEHRNAVLGSLWARRSIEGLMQKMLRGEKPELVKEVIRLSTTFRVLSKYTAFVAVEEKTRTNEKGDPVTVEVPVEIPEGVSFDGVFGEESADEDGAASMGIVGTGKGAGGSSYGMALGGAVMGYASKARVAGVRTARPAVSISSGMLSHAAKAAEPAADRKAIERKLSVHLGVKSATGALSVRAVRAAASSVVASLKRCCAFARTAGVDLPGGITVRIVTDGKGKVTGARVVKAPADLDESLKHCIERMFRAIRLPGAGESLIRIRIKV